MPRKTRSVPTPPIRDIIKAETQAVPKPPEELTGAERTQFQPGQQGHPGTKFQKGRRGNPKGRPKVRVYKDGVLKKGADAKNYALRQSLKVMKEIAKIAYNGTTEDILHRVVQQPGRDKRGIVA